MRNGREPANAKTNTEIKILKPASHHTFQKRELAKQKPNNKKQWTSKPIRTLLSHQASNQEARNCQRGRWQCRSLKILFLIFLKIWNKSLHNSRAYFARNLSNDIGISSTAQLSNGNRFPHHGGMGNTKPESQRLPACMEVTSASRYLGNRCGIDMWSTMWNRRLDAESMLGSIGGSRKSKKNIDDELRHKACL